MKKIFIDCSFIATHPELNTGIQRVVRKVISHIEEVIKKQNKDIQIHLVSLQGEDINIISKELLFPKPKEDKPKQKKDYIQAIRNYFLTLFRAIKQLIVALIPHKKVHNFVYAPRENFGLNFIIDRLFIKPIKFILGKNKPSLPQPSQPAIEFQKDDILLLLDSTWHLDIFPAVKKFKEKDVKIVSIIYDLIPVSHPQFCDDFLVKVFKKWIKNSVKYTDRYIAISNTVKEDLKNYISKEFPKLSQQKSYDYFVLGSDFTPRDIDEKTIDKKLTNIFKQRDTYMMVSTIEPRKNHSFLLDVFDILWEKGEDINLLFVGREGWKVEKLLHRIKSHKHYNKKLYLLSNLSDDELHYCYNKAKVSLFSSFTEGFGLPIVESLANSLPVLASDTPIHREVGKENIEYFSLKSPDDLVSKIQKIQKEGIPKHLKVTDKVEILNWQDSTTMLLEKILKDG